MSLRTRILLFLFIFALLPLVIAVAINLPLVLDRVELFYREAFLQNLRADFQDLDTHLASRDEMVRLLAKLPEPGVVLGQDGRVPQEKIDAARLSYTKWINRILSDQLDIVDIQFLDQEGGIRFWLSRNPETRLWEPTSTPPRRPPLDLVARAIQEKLPSVILTPVQVDPHASDLPHAITLQLLSPLGPSEGKATYGLVVMTVDIGGLMRRDDRTLWVHDDGRYLAAPGMPQRRGDAFSEFPGLSQQFTKRQLVLWEGDKGRTVIWVPLLRTEEDKPLWVGRPVRNEPLRALRDALIFRVLAIILALVVIIGLVARWVAARLERFGSELFEGIRRIVEKGETVTFRWRGSQELAQLGENLSVLAKTHAHNLAELKEHARALEESNRYKSEFLANVSHELRTPLNSILLLSKLLLDKADDLADEPRQQLRVIREASTDLRALIEDVLDLSRIEAGRLQPAIEAVDLEQLMQEISSLMRPQFREKGLILQTQIPAGAPRVIDTDPHKLKQILKNFLSNAVKFTEQGEVVLQLRTAAEPFAVELSVTDSGIGIPVEKQQLIFEAFKQADGSTRRRYGGTGLGLSISRELAGVLCGEIQLHSVIGEGSTFSLLLPRTCGEGRLETEPVFRTVSPRQSASQADIGNTLPSADFSGCRALLIEQDIATLLNLSQLLEAWNVTVVAAGDGEETREALEEEPEINLVLARSGVVDWCAISTIVNGVDRPPPLLIGLTEAEEESDGAECLDVLLSLPVDAGKLADHISNYLEVRKEEPV